MLGNMQADERESGRNYIGLLSNQIEGSSATKSKNNVRWSRCRNPIA